MGKNLNPSTAMHVTHVSSSSCYASFKPVSISMHIVDTVDTLDGNIIIIGFKKGHEESEEFSVYTCTQIVYIGTYACKIQLAL